MCKLVSFTCWTHRMVVLYRTYEQIVSLGFKPHFMCDCGNELFPDSAPCQLNSTRKCFHPTNQYTHNFRDKYNSSIVNERTRWCYCNGENTPPLIECYYCHDWFHRQCIESSFPWDDERSQYVCRSCRQAHVFVFVFQLRVEYECMCDLQD